MSEKKIVVPEGMLKAALAAANLDFRGCGRVEEALRAALRWLSENPIGPTKEQDHDLAEWSEMNIDECPFKEWVRRMFLAPEPEVLGEIADLTLDPEGWMGERINYRIIEAFRRGQKSKKSC